MDIGMNSSVVEDLKTVVLKVQFLAQPNILIFLLLQLQTWISDKALIMKYDTLFC